MSIYVLDTDTVTFQQAGRETVLRRLAAVPAAMVYTTVITLREQLRGRLAAIDQATEGPVLVRAYEQLQATLLYFNHINVLPLTVAASARLADLREMKVRVGTQDLRIAAIVLSVNGVLVTSNRRDFDQVPGLAIEDWNI
jgi:tRNA(fMet)-specific endonuclease VapC